MYPTYINTAVDTFEIPACAEPAIVLLIRTTLGGGGGTADGWTNEKLTRDSIPQVPTTQLAKMSIDPKFVELAADVAIITL